MIDRLAGIIETILTREGGFVNNPHDAGRATNFGITIGTLSEVRVHPATLAEVQALTRDEAAAIYRSRYITGPGYDGIESYPLLDLIVDTAVNNGRGRATKWLQEVAGVAQDGVIGAITTARVNSEPRRIYLALCVQRLKAYGQLISDNHSQAIFAAGWINRVADFILRI